MELKKTTITKALLRRTAAACLNCVQPTSTAPQTRHLVARLSAYGGFAFPLRAHHEQAPQKPFHARTFCATSSQFEIRMLLTINPLVHIRTSHACRPGPRAGCLYSFDKPQGVGPLSSTFGVLASRQGLCRAGTQFERLGREGKGEPAGLHRPHHRQIDALLYSHEVLEVAIFGYINDPDIQ